MKKTLLLVFIHGFKGTDDTFEKFPRDLSALLSHALPKIKILHLVYPQFETRGDLKACVARFKGWLQDKVIDLEVANGTPSPTVDPSVHVVLCGHSMGGIVAAETLLSIAMDEPISASTARADDKDNTTSTTAESQTKPVNLNSSEDNLPQGSVPLSEPSTLLFPFIHAVLNFDSPMLGISPGVLAHGAEMQINHATTAYKAFDTASSFFGWKTSPGSAPPTTPNASGAKVAAANGSLWQKWGNYAMVGGAAATVAGIAGAAYLNWNQINQGLAWAGSHLEFVGCLARGAELQQRVEAVVRLTRERDVGFANFYGVLGEKVTGQTKYAGAVLGEDRTFCVIPRNTKGASSPTGSKRSAPDTSEQRPSAKRPMRTDDAKLNAQMDEGQKVQDFARDTTKSKGHWVPCVNGHASDEVVAHTTMFSPDANPDYYDMVARARDLVAEWVDGQWYADATTDGPSQHEHEDLYEPVD